MAIVNDRPTFTSYLAFILAPPISVWWVIITGAIGITSWIFVPSDLLTISKIAFLSMIVFASFIFIVGLSVVLRGWSMYSGSSRDMRVAEIVKSANERVFVLENSRDLEIGSILELYRIQESIEVPIGCLEATHKRMDGVMQASPVWILSGHLRDIETGGLSVQNLMVCRTLKRNTLADWVEIQAQAKLKELLRRGGMETKDDRKTEGIS